MNNTILQFPNGEEQDLEDFKAKPLEGTELTKERDKFLLWEIRRNLAPTIGALLASTQGGRDE